jgi:anaerobic magnesium-protoporphyrin IX monomethyl ester cyclase
VRVLLIYPPPWKLAAAGAAPFGPGQGPPAEYREGDLDADFYQTPYGLFALGAMAIRAGHSVKVINVSAYPWVDVERVLSALKPDVLGMSCWTANRRGVAFAAEFMRRTHPATTIVVGGPHATPLAEELLQHTPSIDVVCVGESDVTFRELLDRKAAGASFMGLAGAVVREGTRTVRGPKRKNIEDLDTLACPQHYFPTHIVMTSRGCPWACTFCGAEASWGRGFRSNSIEYVVDAMASALRQLPVKMLQIKDDTFTTHKKRVIELCRAIRARGLQFFWSCDTRVDLLSEELLLEMRLAGCQRLSLGVESGSQTILDAIDKKITPAEILESTQLAKKVGIKVRYYMMLGNRGETKSTFDETLAFLELAKPHEYVFACLSIYPGTRDFADAEKRFLDRQIYFKEDFQEFKTPFDADEATTAYLDAWFREHHGLRTMHRDGVAEYRDILARVGEYHAAHMDLGAALAEEGALDEAELHIRRAQALGYPLPGLALNHLACIAYRRGNLDAMMDLFSEAAKVDPQHWVLIQNVKRARAWFSEGGYARKETLQLDIRHDFQLLERTVQPTLPGPLPDDFAEWVPPRMPPQAAVEYIKTPEQEGSTAGPRRLRVVQ